MHEVHIYYNPYSESTRLVVDGAERRSSAGRVDDYIIGKPISNWLAAYSESYYHWSGILPELMENLNDDELDLTFHGSREHCKMLEEALQTQRTCVEELGFEFGHWKLVHREDYSACDFTKSLSKFVKRFKPNAPDQESLMLFDRVELELGQAEAPTVEELTAMADRLRTAVTAARKYYAGNQLRNYSMRINFWKNAEKILDHILEGGVL